MEGRLQRYERVAAQENWRPAGEPISIVVGKNGLGWGIGVIDDPGVRGAGTLKLGGYLTSSLAEIRMGPSSAVPPHDQSISLQANLNFRMGDLTLHTGHSWYLR